MNIEIVVAQEALWSRFIVSNTSATVGDIKPTIEYNVIFSLRYQSHVCNVIKRSQR